jgi:parvulin-like peptidyl-prolyl isomerase
MKKSLLLISLATGLAVAIPSAIASTPQPAAAKPVQKPAPAKSDKDKAAQPATPAKASVVDDPILVKGEGLELRRSDFELEKKSVPPDQRLQLSTNMERIQRTLERMTVNRAMLDELRKTDFEKDPVVQAELKYTYDQKLVSLYVAKLTADIALPNFEPAMREKYKLQAAQLTEPEKVRASHILVTSKTRSKDEARKRAEEVRAKALAGANFIELVKEYSEDPSARRNSGDMGYFPAAQMVPEFSKAAFALVKEGDISPVVETEFGFHVIRFVDRQPSRTPTFEEVRPTYLEEFTREYQGQQLRLKLDQIIMKKKPQVNMDEVNKLIDNSSARAAAEFNAKIRKEIEESQRKKAP